MSKQKIKIKVLGNYAPNLKGIFKYPCSGYYVKGFKEPIMLDFGLGIFPRFLKELKKEAADIFNTIFIISHNHIDHSFGMIPLSFFLSHKYILQKIKKISRKKETGDYKKVKIYLPKRSLMYVYAQLFKKVFDIHVINAETEFIIEDFKFSFCQTEHRGESYATKIEKDECNFVYTSDMAYVSRQLKFFCEYSCCTLIDAGHPNKDSAKTLPGYHGKTQEVIEDLIDVGVREILASHLKASLKPEDYMKVFPEDYNIQLVSKDKEYEIL